MHFYKVGYGTAEGEYSAVFSHHNIYSESQLYQMVFDIMKCVYEELLNTETAAYIKELNEVISKPEFIKDAEFWKYKVPYHMRNINFERLMITTSWKEKFCDKYGFKELKYEVCCIEDGWYNLLNKRSWSSRLNEFKNVISNVKDKMLKKFNSARDKILKNKC